MGCSPSGEVEGPAKEGGGVYSNETSTLYGGMLEERDDVGLSRMESLGEMLPWGELEEANERI